MLNLRNPLGRRIDVKVNANVTSGNPTYVTGILGIPVDHALSGTTVTFIQEGIVSLTYTGGMAIGLGSFLYWDVSAANITTVPGAADLELGQCLGADPDGVSNKYLVRMNVGYPRAAAGQAQSSMAE